MAVILSQSTEEWTTNKVIEEFTYELATCEDYLINEYGEYVSGRPYYDQAKYLHNRIPLYRPVPTFKVRLNHLSDRLKHELDGYSNDRESLTYVLKQSVGRIFENVNSRQYHESVASLLEVEFI